MKVQCSKCESKYNIKDEKIPDAGAKIKCPKCQNVISVMKPEPEPPALSSEDLTKDFGKDSGELFGILMLICPLLAAFLIWVIPTFLVGHGNFESPSIIIVFSAIIITAILAAVEASQLGIGTTYSGKKETGPIGFFLGILLMWVISYPFYFYKRWRRGKKNLLFGSILVTVVFIVSMGTTGFSFGNIFNSNIGNILNRDIAIVKNGTLQKYPRKTVGEAIEGFMENPKWEAITATDGNPYVNVKGKILYDGKKAKAALQFRIYREKGTFEINAFEINRKPANRFELWALLDKMYASSGGRLWLCFRATKQ